MAVHIRKVVTAPLVLKGKAFVVYPQQMEYVALEIVYVHLVLHGIEAEIVRGSIGKVRFHRGTGH